MAILAIAKHHTRDNEQAAARARTGKGLHDLAKLPLPQSGTLMTPQPGEVGPYPAWPLGPRFPGKSQLRGNGAVMAQGSAARFAPRATFTAPPPPRPERAAPAAAAQMHGTPRAPQSHAVPRGRARNRGAARACTRLAARHLINVPQLLAHKSTCASLAHPL